MRIFLIHPVGIGPHRVDQRHSHVRSVKVMLVRAASQ